MTPQEYLVADQQLIETALERYFTEDAPWRKLNEAMRYSLMAGGKRIRPVLTLESCRICGGDVEKAMPLACALEMIHTYSLIHDDLPCMDNDDYRRGKLTCHKVFGDNNAILAGDGLLTAAFGVVANSPELSDEQALESIRCMTNAAGETGMVAGQVLDLEWDNKPDITAQDLELVNEKKTSALLCAAMELGRIAAGGTEEQSRALKEYAIHLGIAFQIRDDILDVVGDEATMGKHAGADAENEKTTFVTLYGLEGSQEMVERLTEKAKKAVKNCFDRPEFLLWLADYLSGREK